VLRRRSLTVPGYLAAWLLWLAATPLWLPLAALLDLARASRGAALRGGAMLACYLTCEAVGLLLAGALWLWRAGAGMDRSRWAELHFRLEAVWGTALFRAATGLYGMCVEVEGEAEADLSRGPCLLLLRHASTADTLLAAALVSRPHGLRLRYVLKRELLWDPCLDVVGNRLPNVFVDRSSEDTAAEVRRVQDLGRGLGPRDGVLIYPEGTRFSAAKRRRALERLGRGGDAAALAYAESLTSVLPPRPGGTLALLEAAPGADVVVCAHSGFEGTASLADVWRGALVGRRVRVRFRRIPRSRIPSPREARSAWLRDVWREVDAWVAGAGEGSAST
jgi:1-acyl-sn-glycerol-3-phosphate acyltransferase